VVDDKRPEASLFDNPFHVRRVADNVTPVSVSDSRAAAPRTDFLHVEIDHGVATVWMAKPPVNAVSLAMFKEFPRVFGWLAGREDLAVVILASRVRHFCAGTDLNDFEAMTAHTVAERNAHVRAAFFAVDDCPLPTIASVHGACLGSGVALAASCDMVIAARDARFGTPEVSVGVMGGAHHLGRLVPRNVMRKMYFTAEPVRAAELAAYGGIVDLVDAEELSRATRELAARIAQHDRTVLRHAKRTLDTIEHLPLQEGYVYEQSQTAELTSDERARASLARTRARIGKA